MRDCVPCVEEPVLQEGETRLFVDDRNIARREGVVRRTHPCRKLPEPVLTAEEPWEVFGDDRRVYVYGTVLREPADGTLRMWYMRYPDRILHAISDDGIRWSRPDLGLVPLPDSPATNILPISLHSPSLVYDSSGSYQMLGSGTVDGQGGYYAARSPDGLTWQLYDRNPVLTGGDTCTLAHDPHSGEYLAFHKRKQEHRGHRRRVVYLSVSRDMQRWSDPELIMAPDETDDRLTRSEGGICSEFYNMSAFLRDDQWLGLVTHFRYAGPPAKKGPEQSSYDGPIDVQLIHSPDGRTWHRCDDRSPVIPNGPYPYDAGCVLGVANGPVFVGDEMWLYYTGITTMHGGPLPEKQISIARAAWRLDGLVSLSAGSGGGTVETVPFHPSGDRLFVNVDAGRGELRVELLDATGSAIPGCTADACEPIREDAVRLHASWRDRDTLPADRPLRLRFHLQNAHLFSYATAPSPKES